MSISTLESRATRTALAAMYANPVTPAAIEMAQEQVCQDTDLFADFLAGDVGKRAFCAYFGAITVTELARVLTNRKATAGQVVAARDELLSRFLADQSEYVMRLAAEMVMA